MLRFQFDQLNGPGVKRSRKTLGDLAGVFANDSARAALPPETLAYEVLMHAAVPEDTAGGLFFGISLLSPGNVDGECFMTRGHFHAKSDRAEYYWGISGTGLLLLMTRDRACRVEEVRPGSLHYIPGETAHRLVNTGDERLAVGACWPSDAGHDYASIARDGFSLRVYRRLNGQVDLVGQEAPR
jgi:glucose-6-phosphate isomerase